MVNRYCDISGQDGGQEDGYVLLPFFMALRAAVRAHVTAAQAESSDGERDRLTEEARAYFDLAERLLERRPARLVAVGGLSGSGKSTIAAALAPHLGQAPGARVIGSDRTRKAMYHTAPDQPLPQEAYAPDVSARVYAEIARRAEALLADGVTVIADAVHDRAEDRTRIARVAAAAGVPFAGFWLQADPEALHARLETRDPGASDADAEVLADQLARAPQSTDWQTVSTGGTVTDSLNELRARVTRLGDTPSQSEAPFVIGIPTERALPPGPAPLKPVHGQANVTSRRKKISVAADLEELVQDKRAGWRASGDKARRRQRRYKTLLTQQLLKRGSTDQDDDDQDLDDERGRSGLSDGVASKPRNGEVTLPTQSFVELKDLKIPAQIGTYGPQDVVPEAHLLDLTLTM